jgi:transcription antitermination protein NusB
LKTPFDPRHQRRRNAIRGLFAWGFSKQTISDSDLAADIVKNIDKIDGVITDCAPEWPIDQINRLDLAVLRLAVYELTITNTEPHKVIIDEAVELAKEFGGESSPSFVNGVLGTALKKWTKN